MCYIAIILGLRERIAHSNPVSWESKHLLTPTLLIYYILEIINLQKIPFADSLTIAIAVKLSDIAITELSL